MVQFQFRFVSSNLYLNVEFAAEQSGFEFSSFQNASTLMAELDEQEREMDQFHQPPERVGSWPWSNSVIDERLGLQEKGELHVSVLTANQSITGYFTGRNPSGYTELGLPKVRIVYRPALYMPPLYGSCL